MIKEFFKKVVRKKDKPWKIDIYSGIKGKRSHSHITLSGATLMKDEAVEGEIYYQRDNGKVLVNKDESGKDLLK